MKALKITGIIALALAALVFVLNLFASKSFDMERSIVINAPKEAVFSHVQYLEKHDAWSPWREYDPDMKTVLTGTDGTVGATSSWDGNDDVGKGSQTLTKVQPYDLVEAKLVFLEPFESSADAYFILSDAGNGATKVTWGFRSPMPFPFNIMGLFMNMEKEIGADYEKGLAKLKALVEKQSAPIAYEVKESQSATPAYYIGIRETVPMDKLTERMSEHFPKLVAAIQAAGIEMAGMPSGLYFTWDEAKQETDFAAAIPVKTNAALKGFTTFEYPAGTTLSVDYYGLYDKIGPAHEAIDAHIQRHNWKQGPMVVEEYISDPGEQPDPAKWLTRVMYPVTK